MTKTAAELVRSLISSSGMQQKDIAAALGVAQSAVSRWLDGAEPRSGTLEKLRELAAERKGGAPGLTCPIVGFVRGGSEMELYAEGQGPFDVAPLPAGSSAGTVAAIVRGDSMAGRADDGDIIYFDERRAPGDDMIGRLCVIGLEDGRVLVKKLMRSNGTWILSSLAADPIIVTTADILWAARVRWIKPR